jgi:N4-gp56 family major capsid protein
MAASDNVSPVVAADTPEGKILSVGTRSAGLPTGGTLQELITTAYDLTVFDQVAVLRPTNLSHNGAVIQLNLVNDLDDDPTTAVLDEDYDVLPTPLTSWKHSVTLFEYGRVVTKTALIRATSMTPLDPIAAERVGRNMAATMDRLLYNTLVASGGISNSGGAGGAVAAVTVSGKPSATLFRSGRQASPSRRTTSPPTRTATTGRS